MAIAPHGIAQFHPIGAGHTNYFTTGSATGYIKAGSGFFTKDKIRNRCNIFSTQLAASPTFNYYTAAHYKCAFFFNTSDTSTVKSDYFTSPSATYPMNLTENGCVKCIDDPAYKLDFLRFPNEYSSGNSISNPFSQNAVGSSINAITIYHGTWDIFFDFLGLHLKNVLPGGIAYINNRLTNLPTPLPVNAPTHIYSRIFRFQDYFHISSPDATNLHTILGLKGKTITYNPGYVDNEGDSLNIIPLLLHVADSNGRHPLVHMRENWGCGGAAFLPWMVDTMKKLIKHAAPIQYQPGYSFTNPFGAGSSFILNNKTGEFSFTPADTGLYLLAFRVEEYRNGQLLGDCMNYRLASVKDTSVTVPVISAPFAISGASFNSSTQTFQICPGQTMSYKAKATSTLAGSQIVLESNATQSAPGSTVSYTGQSTDSAVYSFTWTPSQNDLGPHYIYLDAVDTACGPGHYPVHQNSSVIINVGGSRIVSTDTLICQGDTAKLQNWSPGAYQWSILPGGDPALSCTTCPELKVTPNITTTYVLQRTDGDCAGFRDSFTVKVIQNFTISAGNDTSFTGGLPPNYRLNVNVTPPATYYQYTWIPSNKVDTFTLKSPRPINTTNTNTYIVSVQDPYGCFSKKDTIIVRLNTAGVSDIANENRIDIYPNPFSNNFNIHTSSAGMLTIKTIEGKKLATYKINKGNNELVLPSSAATGTYIANFKPNGVEESVSVKLEYRP
jgi:hypothetical protein